VWNSSLGCGGESAGRLLVLSNGAATVATLG